MKPEHAPKVGLILTGGGARAAYQVGVLQAIADMLPAHTPNPFRVICGTSAGAVNAVGLASHIGDFRTSIGRLLRLWGNLHVGDVYRSGAFDVVRSLGRWLGSLLSRRWAQRTPVSLFDNSPLAALLERHIDFSGIRNAIDTGVLDALCVTASGYASGQSISFFQGCHSIAPWQRARRIGIVEELSVAHVLASSAIPFVFPPVKLGDGYYGDGSMQQLAPFSPALHLGAERIMAICVGRAVNRRKPVSSEGFPSLAQITGHLLDCVFLDTLEMDLERLQRINHTISLLPSAVRDQHGVSLRRVETFMMSPSEVIEDIALRYADALPAPVRFLLRCMGASGKGGSNLLSYLLFEKPYCRALVRLGFKDAMAKKSEILSFLGHDPVAAGRRPLKIQRGQQQKLPDSIHSLDGSSKNHDTRAA